MWRDAPSYPWYQTGPVGLQLALDPVDLVSVERENVGDDRQQRLRGFRQTGPTSSGGRTDVTSCSSVSMYFTITCFR